MAGAAASLPAARGRGRRNGPCSRSRFGTVFSALSSCQSQFTKPLGFCEVRLIKYQGFRSGLSHFGRSGQSSGHGGMTPEGDSVRRSRATEGSSLNRPVGNGGVDFGHQADGLVDGDNHFFVVLDVLVRERAAAAVLQPLLAGLVAADPKLPHLAGDALEVLPADTCLLVAFVDVDAARLDGLAVLRARLARRNVRIAEVGGSSLPISFSLSWPRSSGE